MIRASPIENITHVADATENRGRVVLQVCSSRPNAVALDAALWIARAFGASIESVCVEEQQLLDLAGHAFVREIALGGQSVRQLCEADMIDSIASMLRAARRDIDRAALHAGVAHRSRIVRGDPLRALALACLDRGPWNVVALMDPLGVVDRQTLNFVLRQMPGATGILVVGPKARGIDGPIVIALEDAGRLAQKLNLARRLAAHDAIPIVILPIGARPGQLDVLEEQIRLVLDNQDGVSLAACAVTLGSTAAAADVLRRQGPGLVIAELGRIAVPDDRDLRALMCSLACPLFLVR
jgi:hypothetical protein